MRLRFSGTRMCFRRLGGVSSAQRGITERRAETQLGAGDQHRRVSVLESGPVSDIPRTNASGDRHGQCDGSQ